MPPFDKLDAAAAVNLIASDLDKYFKYKKELIADGEPEEEIEMILTGFIWDLSEE